MDLKQRMKLYEASHQKEKLILNESLFEDTEDITELVRKDTEAYKEMKKYRKGSKAYNDAYAVWLDLHAQLTKKMFGGNVSFTVNEGIEEADIPEEDPIIAPTVEEESHEAPEVVTTPEENGVQNMVQFLIKDEWDAIEGYNNTIQTLKDMGGYDDLCGVLQEISNEELVHVGQLQKALEFVNPVTAKIKEGEEEATEQMTEPSTLPEEV